MSRICFVFVLLAFARTGSLAQPLSGTQKDWLVAPQSKAAAKEKASAFKEIIQVRGAELIVAELLEVTQLPI